MSSFYFFLFESFLRAQTKVGQLSGQSVGAGYNID